MKIVFTRIYLLFTIVFWVMLSGRGYCAIESHVNAVYNPVANNTFSVQDDKFQNASFTWSNINNLSVKDAVSLKIVDSALLSTTTFSYTVNLKIDYYTTPGGSATTTYQSLVVSYTAGQGAACRMMDTYNFTKAYKIVVTVQTINTTGPLVPARSIQLSSRVVVDRTYLFQPSASIAPAYTLSSRQLQVSWNPPGTQYMSGASEYDLEWTTINNGNASFGVIDGQVKGSNPGSAAVSAAFTSIFRNNGSRVTTSDNSYSLSLMFNDTYLLVRIRQAQYLAGGVRQTGVWDIHKSDGTYAIFAINWNESPLNWQYSAAFAEEGKKKEVMSYFDGTLRGRQTVTISNTDTVAIAQESIYDATGRPVASILPAPYKETGVPYLHYVSNFNVNSAGAPYSYSDVNGAMGSDCEPLPAVLGTTAGAARYYSSQNQFLSKINAKYIPDAGGYPLSVTQYTSDNTGRIKVQGGVGPVFQPGTGTSPAQSKTTKYYYGKPEQWELDQMFGSDAGYAEQYMKNLVVDPNGQASVSYMNASGKTVATALTGSAPATLDAVANYKAPVTQRTHILNPSQFVYNSSAMKLAANTTYLNETVGTGTLSYNIQKLIDLYPGGAFQVCSNCYYLMTVNVLDACGDTLSKKSAPVGSLTSNCTDNVTYQDSISVNFPQPGEYFVNIEFAFSKDVINSYTDNFVAQGLKNGNLQQQFNYIKNNYLNGLDFSGSYSDCTTCKTLLGSQADFAQALKDKYLALNVDATDAAGTRFNDWADSVYVVLKTQCTAIQANCQVSPCASIQDEMQTDVSPGGQYALIDTQGNPLEPTNVLSEVLPGNTQPNWRIVFPVHTTKDSVYLSEQIVLPDSTITSPYDASFTFKNLVTYWKPSWATKFLLYHPEYCKLQFCMNNQVPESWDAQVQTAINTAADVPTIKVASGPALSYAYTNSPDWLLKGDPFFVGGNGAGYYTSMQNDLLYYSKNVLSIPDTLGHQVKSIMSYSDYILYCSNNNGASTNASANQDNWDNCVPVATCRVADREWVNYRSYYFQLKDKYYTLARNASCGTSCQIGQPLTSPLPGSAPLLADFSLTPDTAVAACPNSQALIVSHGGGSVRQPITVNLTYPTSLDNSNLTHSVAFNTGDIQQVICVPNNIPLNTIQIQTSTPVIYVQVSDIVNKTNLPNGTTGRRTTFSPVDAKGNTAALSSQVSLYATYTQTLTNGSTTTMDVYIPIPIGSVNVNYDYTTVGNGYTNMTLTCEKNLSGIYMGAGTYSCSGYTAPVPPPPSPDSTASCPLYYVNKTSRFPTVPTAQAALSQAQGTSVIAAGHTAMIAQVSDICTQNAAVWISKLNKGLIISGKTSYTTQLQQALIAVCTAGGDSLHPMGASNLAGDPHPGSSTYSSFEQAIKGVTGITTFTTTLNPWLIDSPYPYSPGQQSVPKTISSTTTDLCSLLQQLTLQASAANTDLYSYLVYKYGAAMTISKTDVANLQNSCNNCRFILAKDVTLPVFLDPGATGTITAATYQSAKTALSAKFGGIRIDTSANYQTIYSNFMNQQWGFSLSFSDYAAYDTLLVSNPSAILVNTLPYSSVTADPYASVKSVLETAVSNGKADYAAYIAAQRQLFQASYIAKCSAAQANASLTASQQLYHYTLYYYDQADNLVRTVPPEGVTLVPSSNFTAIDTARSSGDTTKYVYPSHVLTTTYAYNATNQVVQQSTPDGGTNRFWYDLLSRLVVSQNDRQLAAPNNYSYTVYDTLGRIKEVGQKTQSTLNIGTPSYLSADTVRRFLAAGANSQITHTYYDSVATAGNGIAAITGQLNLRKRVAAVTYADTSAGPVLRATYYNYDIDGNVSTLWQQVDGLYVAANTPTGMKRIDYEYDLVSGKVNFVRYQDNTPDRYYYKYVYDAENRVTQAQSGTEAITDLYTGSALLPDNRRTDAQYYYYLHGPLARMELGDNKVQGVDYAYTLQGWLKGVNSSSVSLSTNQDMGQDAAAGNPTIAADAYGYSLSYYGSSTTLDYKPITGTQPFSTSFAAANSLRQLYNGNITASGMNVPQLSAAYWLDRKYTYDQLNRLTGAQLYHTTASVAPAGTSDYRETFSYDGNGNILTANRHGSTTGGGQQLMDSLAYFYNRDANSRLVSNRLNYLTDKIPATNYTTDLENQSANNYTYDQTGNLTSDAQAGVSKVNWSVYGKIRSLMASSGNISYTYNPSGQRVSKTAGGITTWYIRDAQGNTLAVYDNAHSTVNWREQELYGSSRLGNWLPNLRVGIDSSISRWDTTGHKQYELSNHLGNVMLTVTDKRLQHTTNNTSVDYYMADVSTAQDYYAFGALMPARTYTFTAGKNYRYGFNGKENDNEVKGTGNQQDYGMRIYDPRLGRFLSVDPITGKYPWYSPYQFAGNTPIQAIDLDGLEPAYTEKSGRRIGARDGGLARTPTPPPPKLAPTDAEKLKADMQKLAADPIVGYLPDKYGLSSPVRRSEVAALEQQHRDYLGDVTSSSPAASIGYLIGGEKGMLVGQIVGGVSMARYGNGAPGVFSTQMNTVEPNGVPSIEWHPADGVEPPILNIKIRPAGMSAMEWGNQLHYDKLAGGTGDGLPTQLQKLYPLTEFEFTGRGVKGADVKVVGGKKPWLYPGSTWKAENLYGDFKTISDKKFSGEINSGKLPQNTQKLTYDPSTGQLQN